ncbi:MAG: ABC transporter permease [Bifidobacteriaceae bacterium]|jgi:D-methionine transport system permease protein|nr:ABC transporter permease [Bifidobacteriaceae bacterium]
MSVLPILAALPLVGAPAAGDKGTFLNNPDFTSRIWEALGGTVGQAGISCLAGVVLGLPLGLAVWYTAAWGLRPTPAVNRVLNALVDLGRSVPFIVLMLLLIGFTRWLLGSSLGWQAGIPPLAIGCVPFYARLAENAIRQVPLGKIEAAQMAGASRWQITWGVAVRESRSGLVSAATVTFITLIGYSMITGTIGAGGLGDLVYNWGYTRNMTDILVMVVVIVLVLVEAVQILGDLAARALDHSR